MTLSTPRWLFMAHARRSTNPTAFEVLESRTLLSTTWFVSPLGSDHNPGTASAPFRTIQDAANVARPGDKVLIHAGTYRETVTPVNSGTSGAPITFEPYGDGPVVVSGANLVSGFQDVNGPIYNAYPGVNLGEGLNQVFVNGQMVNEARWPATSLDLSHPTFAYASSESPVVLPMGYETTSTLRDPQLTQPYGFWDGATIHILPGQGWVSETGTVISSQPGQLTFEFQQMNVPYALPSAGDRYFLTGKSSALDAPGEYFLNPATGTLSLWAPNSENPNNDTVEVKARQDAFDLSGKSFINIQGLEIFAATIETNGASAGININGINAEYVSQNTDITNGWENSQPTGIELFGNNDVIENSVVAFSSGNGIEVQGSGDSVVNNLIHDVDYNATDYAGIVVTGSGNQAVSNTIYNSGRDGIKISGSYQTLVSRNLIHDVMLQTTDGGAIYTYGTDGAGSQISYNRIYNVQSGGYGAAGLYLDNYSSEYLVEYNVVSNCDWALKLNPPSTNNQIIGNVLADSASPLATSPGAQMYGTVFRGNTYTGFLSLGPGAINEGNSYQPDPSLPDPSNGGAHPIAPVTSQASAGAAYRRTPTPTPAPRPTPSPNVARAPSDSVARLWNAFLVWHASHKNVSRVHSDWYVFYNTVGWKIAA